MADDDNEEGFTERTIGDWTAYQDDDGRTYYHNEATGESSWDPPPGFEDDAIDPGAAEAGDGDDNDGAAAAAAAAAAADGDDVDEDGAQSDQEFGGAQTPPLDGDGNDQFTGSPAAMDADGDLADDNDGITQSPPMDAAEAEGGQESEPTGNEEEGAADGEDIGNGWVAYKDDDGNIYYYNAESGETQWDRPDVGEVATSTETEKNLSDANQETNKEEIVTPTSPISSPPQESSSLTDRDGDSPKSKDQSWPADKDDDEKMDTDPTSQEEAAQKEEAKIDNAATAEKFLQLPDAVMEPNVLDHINVLVKELGPQVAGPKAMQSLMNGYGGDTAICGLMALWLADLKATLPGGPSEKKGGMVNPSNNKTNTSKEDDQQVRFQTVGANTARDIVEDVVNRLAKERFTRDRGDAILQLSGKDAAFIDKMIKSERWRKLLIDLSATPANKDSKLFMYCLLSISNLGHHRDIADRINQSDYFDVFKSMLQSELCIAARVAVDGYTKEVMDSIDYSDKGAYGPLIMGSLIADMRRTCTSTSYTYLYAMEVLKELISKSNKKLLLLSKENGSDHHVTNGRSSLKRAIRKWERLREELEDEMLKPVKTGTTFQRKRRIDVALTMSDLFQRKRRRVDPRVDTQNHNSESDHFGSSSSSNHRNNLEDTLDLALIRLLTKNSLGNQIDKEVAENMLKFAYGGSTDRIGDLLIKHPSAVTALLHNLFGSKRIRQLDTKLKCARLVALAVTASERRARAEGSSSGTGSNGSQENNATTEEGSGDEENVLSQIILKGSQICEQLENMVSFAVLDNVEINSAEEGTPSIGIQLSAMCIQHSVVAQGVLIWAKELAIGSDFVTTASYPSLSPCILSLSRLCSRHHSLTRPAVLDISLIFMGHSNREISHRKMQSIKEQCIRLMLWLMTQGLSLTVISAVQNKLGRGSSNGSSEMDSALVRYFFTGILEIVRPPLSLAFVRAFGGLMMKRPFVDALQSKHFEDSKRCQKLIDMFKTAGGNLQKMASWDEDESLLSSLESTYC